MEDTTATVETPSPSAVSAPETPAPAPASEPQQSSGKPEVRDASSLLKSLSTKQYKHYMQTGDLPSDVELKEDSGHELNKGEKILRDMTQEERKTWRETGKLPEKKTETAAKGSEENPAESHPLSRIDSLRAKGGNESEVNRLHMERAASHNERYKTDQAKYSAADQAETMNLAKRFMGQLPQGLLNYLNVAQVHLDQPYSFFREFTRNQAFRTEVLQAAATGNLANAVKVISKFDSALTAKERQKLVSKAPSPATSLNGKATAPVDEAGAALKAGNFRDYMRAANREEFASRKGRRERA